MVLFSRTSCGITILAQHLFSDGFLAPPPPVVPLPQRFFRCIILHRAYRPMVAAVAFTNPRLTHKFGPSILQASGHLTRLGGLSDEHLKRIFVSALARK